MNNFSVPKQFADKWWRLNHLYYITNKHGEKVLFKANLQQKQLFNEAQKHKRHIVLKARQLGITTFVALYFLDEVIFTKNAQFLIIAHTTSDASKIMQGKVHYAIDNLPDAIKPYVVVPKRNTEELVVSHDNGKSSSKIIVDTSGRSGTFQGLHISEFGKICARFPEKAREIITGSIPAAENGLQFIESTAEGQSGRFYEMSMEGLSHQRQGLKLNPRDYLHHFFAWHENVDYVQSEPEIISSEMQKYFEVLKNNHNIELSDQQKYWYVATQKALNDDMKREHPSYPEEAFEQAVEGAVYGKQFAEIDKSQRIMDIAFDATLPVYTAWDIGHSDSTAIWFYQVKHGGFIDFIDYYEMNKEDANHYANVVLSKPYRYSKHHLPHDAANKSGLVSKSSHQLLGDAGLRDITIIPRTESINADISFVRTRFEQVRFKKADSVIEGVKKLRNYQYAWNEKFGRWSDHPMHNDASHAADAFRYAIVSLPKDLTPLASFNPIIRPNKPVNNPKRFV